ncbi:nucleotide 5'-monophosphate nucleosidase PpnN [Vibrio barjaei]|uniref:nucleotide 5'-monophosphate nucleosidase PpnN n=1 Tax=Vibrio barjaei TaxID=1676683 RepID=UPI002285025E|nr:nucleotide 5'-monophosphate nucleosidase PpnN [Vibrio barjaei]MCY9873828.1 nucleotide 5'-monophosphate nucleosidase PpnN [Vibrio barjaei]
MDITIKPTADFKNMSNVEREEIQSVIRENKGLFRKCAMAVLNTGLHCDSIDELLAANKDFDIEVEMACGGVCLKLTGAPNLAFVDGQLIKGISDHLFALVRDFQMARQFSETSDVSEQIFQFLKRSDALHSSSGHKMAVCWGGHSIREHEYQYCREVGSELGVRGYNICTGCGGGVMEAPMKGAAIGHAKQRTKPRFVGLTEVGIIAVEPPNPIVNELIIMPDIEKRLEAFVRIAHGIIIFPGGPGTAEELLYILAIKMHPKNKLNPIPVVLTGPEESRGYFEAIDQFIKSTLGAEAASMYKIVIDDAPKVAQILSQSERASINFRSALDDNPAYCWSLHIENDLTQPFKPTHKNVSSVKLSFEQEPYLRASSLRKIFSAIVAGNIKEDGIAEVKKNGPYVIDGDKVILKGIGRLLERFVIEQRMKLPGSEYVRCYTVKA